MDQPEVAKLFEAWRAYEDVSESEGTTPSFLDFIRASAYAFEDQIPDLPDYWKADRYDMMIKHTMQEGCYVQLSWFYSDSAHHVYRVFCPGCGWWDQWDARKEVRT